MRDSQEMDLYRKAFNSHNINFEDIFKYLYNFLIIIFLFHFNIVMQRMFIQWTAKIFSIILYRNSPFFSKWSLKLWGKKWRTVIIKLCQLNPLILKPNSHSFLNKNNLKNRRIVSSFSFKKSTKFKLIIND